MTGRRIGALDIGGTNIKACLFQGGIPVCRDETPTPAREGAHRVLARAAELLGSMGAFDALGVSTTGQVDPASGVIRYANENMPGYTGTKVKAFFEERFSVPTAVINDVYAAALGEGTYGSVKGETDYICLTYGTGIGGGVILNGKPYYGAGSSAGVMLGGLITHPEDRNVQDAFSGTYERYGATTALVDRAKTIAPELDSGRRIFAELPGNEALLSQVNDWLREVALGICTLVHAYNVPCVVLGGGIMEQPYVFREVKNTAEKFLIPGFRGVRILQAGLGNMAGLYGAASLV